MEIVDQTFKVPLNFKVTLISNPDTNIIIILCYFVLLCCQNSSFGNSFWWIAEQRRKQPLPSVIDTLFAVILIQVIHIHIFFFGHLDVV